MSTKKPKKTITEILRDGDGLGGLRLPAKPVDGRRKRPAPPKISKIVKSAFSKPVSSSDEG